MKEKLRFLGLDVHAETIAVAVAETDGEVRSLGTIPNRAESIRKMIKKLGPAEKLRACYEGGPTGHVVYWQLAELGIQCEVVAPTLVPVKPGDRVKTDRRDAEKLACCYRSGDLTAVWVPDDGSEALRDLVRAREAARQDQMRARHRLSKFLLRSEPASTHRGETMDAPLSDPHSVWRRSRDEGCSAALHTDRSGGHAAGLSARGRAHAGTGGASGASHHRERRQHFLADHRLADHVLKEIRHLPRTGQPTQIAVDNDTVKTVVYKEQQAAKQLCECLHRPPPVFSSRRQDHRTDDRRGKISNIFG